MSEIKISDELFDFVESSPHVQLVHFTADGHHHLNAYTREADGKLYSKIIVDPHVPGDHDAQHAPNEIVATLTRNEILGIDEDDEEEGPTAEDIEKTKALEAAEAAATITEDLKETGENIAVE